MPSDGPVIAERAFWLDPRGDGQADMDRYAEEWRAYLRQPEHLRHALYGYRIRAGASLPEDVAVTTYTRTCRAEHRSYRVGVVIVREATP